MYRVPQRPVPTTTNSRPSFPVVPSVIAGATRPEQIKANVAAGQWTLTPAERDEVTALVS